MLRAVENVCFGWIGRISLPECDMSTDECEIYSKRGISPNNVVLHVTNQRELTSVVIVFTIQDEKETEFHNIYSLFLKLPTSLRKLSPFQD